MYRWLFEQFPIDLAFEIILKTKDKPLIILIIQKNLETVNREKIESRWNDTMFWFSKLKNSKGPPGHLLYDPVGKLPKEIRERECKTWRDKYLNYLCYGSWEDIAALIKRIIEEYKTSESYCKFDLQDDKIYMHFSDRTFGSEFIHSENSSSNMNNVSLWGLPDAQENYINQSKCYFQILEISSIKNRPNEKSFLDQFRELILQLETKFPPKDFSIKYHRYVEYGLWRMIVELTILYPSN